MIDGVQGTMEFKNLTPPGSRVPRSVLIALHTIEVLAQLQPVGVGALSREIALPKSTVQRTLKALEAAGWAYPSGDQVRWSLTLRAFQIGARVARGFDVREVAMPHLEQLRDDTKESVYLSMLDGDRTLILEGVESPHTVRAYAEIGEAFPMHCTSAGKAFLAAADEAFVQQYLSRPLAELTEHSITDPARLQEEIDRVRQMGYAVNARESRPDVVSVSAVVRDAAGGTVAAVVVSGPASRITDEEIGPLSEKVTAAARRISENLGWRI